jgi:hypothetical protein
VRRLSLVLSALVPLVTAPASRASDPPPLTRTGQTSTWSGTLRTPDPTGCGEVASRGCIRTPLTVVATKGTWITIAVDDAQGYLRVTQNGRNVGGNGSHTGTRGDGSAAPSTTFQQVRSGRVVYDVGVSDQFATAATPVTFRATARFAGKAFDREGDCGVRGGGYDHLLDDDPGERLHLSVLLVAAPADVAEVGRVVVPGLVDSYDRIGVAVTVRVRGFALKASSTDYPYVQVRKALDGVRPKGVDVVHLVTDTFRGGVADCIGGVAYPERAFSTGALHYHPTPSWTPGCRRCRPCPRLPSRPTRSGTSSGRSTRRQLR